MICAIKYCGGCNPRFDRVAAVDKICSSFPTVDFISARQAESPAFVLVICGCSVRCAAHENLQGSLGKYLLTAWEDISNICSQMARAIQQNEE